MFGEIIAVIGSFVVPSTIDPSLLQLFGTMDDLIAAGDKKWGYEPAWRAIERGAIVEAEAGAASSGNTMSVEMLPDLIIVTGSEGSGTTMVTRMLSASSGIFGGGGNWMSTLADINSTVFNELFMTFNQVTESIWAAKDRFHQYSNHNISVSWPTGLGKCAHPASFNHDLKVNNITGTLQFAVARTLLAALFEEGKRVGAKKIVYHRSTPFNTWYTVIFQDLEALTRGIAIPKVVVVHREPIWNAMQSDWRREFYEYDSIGRVVCGHEEGNGIVSHCDFKAMLEEPISNRSRVCSRRAQYIANTTLAHMDYLQAFLHGVVAPNIAKLELAYDTLHLKGVEDRLGSFVGLPNALVNNEIHEHHQNHFDRNGRPIDKNYTTKLEEYLKQKHNTATEVRLEKGSSTFSRATVADQKLMWKQNQERLRLNASAEIQLSYPLSKLTPGAISEIDIALYDSLIKATAMDKIFSVRSGHPLYKQKYHKFGPKARVTAVRKVLDDFKATDNYTSNKLTGIHAIDLARQFERSHLHQKWSKEVLDEIVEEARSYLLAIIRRPTVPAT